MVKDFKYMQKFATMHRSCDMMKVQRF